MIPQSDIHFPETPECLLGTQTLQTLPMQSQHHMEHILFQRSKIEKVKNNDFFVALEQAHHEVVHHLQVLDSKANFLQVSVTFFEPHENFAEYESEHVYLILFYAMHKPLCLQLFDCYSYEYGTLFHIHSHVVHKMNHHDDLPVQRCNCHMHNAKESSVSYIYMTQM